MNELTQLHPQPVKQIPLNGAFLAHDLRRLAQDSGKAFVYTNFVVSIDGRIAIPRPSGTGLMVPKMTANDRDWRLYQELAAQADVIISSGRYLNGWANGRVPEIFQSDDPRFFDLGEWRQDQDLSAQPDIAVISSSLRFDIPRELTTAGRRVVVFTSTGSDPNRVKDIESQGGRVFIAGHDSVDIALVIEQMSTLGYQTIYSTAGPKILHLLLSGHVLDRLYLTHANRLLGGQSYASIVEGPLFEPALDLELNTVHYDPYGLNGLGQLFVSYDCV